MHHKNKGGMEFHVSREARDKYGFDQSLFSLRGNVIFANFHAARVFAQKINDRRDLVNFPERVVRAGQINAMGLIDEILHYVIEMYRQEMNPLVSEQALEWVYEQVGENLVNETLREFAEAYPPLAVYNREVSVDEYLEGETVLASGKVARNREIALEEMLMLWLANANPAFTPFLELFDDERLAKETAYPVIITTLRSFFEFQPPYGPDLQNLVDMLQSPAIAVPYSLTGQLEYIRSRWGFLLGKYLYRLLSSLDLVREEEKAIFLGPGPAAVVDYSSLGVELERFSPDKDWMPNLVLLAKNAYVWLDQLSKRYKRPITRLDEIPDEELDRLAGWGFSGLWLIGLWERSPASKRIKQLRGNLDAVASAYSLFNYDIARDLGGNEALERLKDRAWKRGIRLASDMVPNHMGIDSPWVIEHPDWFVSLDYSPFPAYTFNGPDLSWDERVGIYIEDHYYDSTDAAVVFKRVDNWTGSTKYIYHGNDGTSMPWNDTAQLNYLRADVREAVIQTILHVARQFPVIRFDAAMTLAKKHYQRLWFPEPGTGGAIPSRAEHGMTKEEFDAAFPTEFWREVVDRVAQEVPDTLLLAEAFWLMEGYFVRTLGMHRVYNSAFMNMLRDEKNQEYRLVMKNTIEFDPEILKRYVNFMNNPDERTAIDQFGNGDKYFGVCTLMVTMPGLPMFGHGQVQGFAEKYGMEFRRAYWDEEPDEFLIKRHEREIFPLLHRRYLFAGVEHFLLYDFFTPEGNVNEDVYAYSNRVGGERSLVFYHNRYRSTRGWIRASAAYAEKTAEGRNLVQKNLGDGLGLHSDPDYFIIYRDQIRGLEFIRSSRDIHENGLYIELEAYKYYVFVDFREVQDDEWHQYAQLAAYLDGRGVPSIDEALREIFLQPIHHPFRELVNPGMLQWLIDSRITSETLESSLEEGSSYRQAIDEVESKTAALLQEIQRVMGGEGRAEDVAQEIKTDTSAALGLPILRPRFARIQPGRYRDAIRFLEMGGKSQTGLMDGTPAAWAALFSAIFTRKLAKIQAAGSQDRSYAALSRSWIDELLLGKMIAGALQDMGLDDGEAWRSVAAVKLLSSHQLWYDPGEKKQRPAYKVLQHWLQDAEVQNFIGVNRYRDVLWFNQEAFAEFLWWMFTLAVVDITAYVSDTTDITVEEGRDAAEKMAASIEACFRVIQTLQAAARESGYQVEMLLALAKR